MIPPRIRGRVGQFAEPEEWKDKYCFEILVADLYGNNIGDPIGPFGPYDTEEKAKEEMRSAVRMAAESYETKANGQASGEYLDMKNGGIIRKWDEN